MNTSFYRIATNRNTLMILALILGFLASDFALKIAGSLTAVLSLMMSLSLQGVSYRIFSDRKKVLQNSMGGILISYLAFGILLMGIAFLIFGNNRPVLIGFMLIAISPPGVVIIPFAINHKGDIDWTIIGVLAGYLSSLIIVPVSLFLILSYSDIASIKALIYLLFWSVILPMIASRFLRHKAIIENVAKYRGGAINLLFFILIYTVIGINSAVIHEERWLLIKISLVLAATLFGGSYLWGYFAGLFGISKSRIRAQQLMFGIKNNGFSAILAITLGSKEMALPSVILSIVLLIFLIFFDLIAKKGED